MQKRMLRRTRRLQTWTPTRALSRPACTPRTAACAADPDGADGGMRGFALAWALLLACLLHADHARHLALSHALRNIDECVLLSSSGPHWPS